MIFFIYIFFQKEIALKINKWVMLGYIFFNKQLNFFIQLQVNFPRARVKQVKNLQDLHNTTVQNLNLNYCLKRRQLPKA